MANVGERTFSHKPDVIEFVPSSAWTEDSNGHYLLVDLPDFKKKEVKLQVDTSCHIRVSGERLVGCRTNIYRFDQAIKLPPNSDIDKISGKFDSGILYVTVPKRVVEEKELAKGGDGDIVEEIKQETSLKKNNENASDDEKGKNSRVDSFPENVVEKWGKEPNQLERAIKIAERNKGIVLTAIIAFSLGWLISRKLRSVG